MDRALERWLSLLILCNTTTQIAVVIKNFVNQSLNLASVPLPKVLHFIITEKGTSSMQASQGLLSLLKTVFSKYAIIMEEDFSGKSMVDKLVHVKTEMIR